MANLIAKLKGGGFKDLLIDHGEKIVLGLIVLMALGCAFGARWAGIDRKPEDLVSQVTTARDKIHSPANKWPDADRQELEKSEDIRDKAEMMMTSLESSWFQYNSVIFWPLYRKQEPIREPEWLPVVNLRADYGQVILALRSETGPDGLEESNPEESDLDAEGGEMRGKMTTKLDEDIDPDFAERGGTRSTGRGAYSDPGGEEMMDPGGMDMTGAEGMLDEMAADGAERAVMMDGGYGGGQQNGRGARYVAVRGVFWLQAQIEKIARAMNIDVQADAAGLVDILDFELERQTAVAGPNPWSGEWDPVSLDVAKDILKQTEAFEPDMIDGGLISDSMTMPLPSRVSGIWGSRATHPDLQDFKLSKEQMDRQLLIHKAIIEKQKTEMASRPPEPLRGGFSSMQHDIRGMTRRMFSGTNTRTRMEMFGRVSNIEELKKRLMEDLESRNNPIGRLLLFRYFDFDVEPGYAYRYRVRLTLRNPNFERPVEQLLNPESASHPTRQTAWSEPTPPVIVEQDVEYYLAGVSAPVTRPADVRAAIDIFQWDPDVGTQVNKKLELQSGQIIGGLTTAEVLDPARQTFEEEDYEFNTGDILVDIEDGPVVKEDLHPELELTKVMKGRGASLGINDQVLVVNKFGEVVALDESSKQAAHGRAAAYLDRWHEKYEYLKQKDDAPEPGAGGDLEAMAAGMYGAAEGSSDMMDPYESAMRAANPLDKRRGSKGRGRR